MRMQMAVQKEVASRNRSVDSFRGQAASSEFSAASTSGKSKR